MAKAGDQFIVELKETHLGWGTPSVLPISSSVSA